MRFRFRQHWLGLLIFTSVANMRKLLLLFAILYNSLFFLEAPLVAQTKALDSLRMELDKSAVIDTNRMNRIYSYELLMYEYNLDEFGHKIGELESISEQLNSPDGKAYTLILKSYYSYNKGKFSEALDFAQKGLAQSLAINDYWQIAKCYGLMATLHNNAESSNNISNSDKAIEYMKEELFWTKKIKDNELLCVVNTQLALAYLDKNQFDSCIATATAGLELTKDFNKMAYSENIIGRALMTQKHFLQAETHFEKAIDLAEKNELSRVKPILYINYGINLYHLNKLNEAEKYLLKSLDLSDQMPPSKQLICLRNLAKVKTAQNEPEKANSYLEKYIELNEKIVHEKQNETFLDLQTKYETQKKDLENEVLTAKNSQIQTHNILYRTLAGSLLVLFIGAIVFYIKLNKRTEALNTSNSIKDRLFSIIAHDLKRPANAFQNLMNSLQFLIKKQQFDRLQAFGQEGEVIAVEMNLLLDNLLRWGALTQRKNYKILEVFNTVPYLNDVLEEFASSISIKNIEIHKHIPAEQIIHFDKSIFTLAIRNILGNAVKFTHENGEIWITFEEKADIQKIIIRDNGIGIPPEILQNLFKMEEHNQRKGTSGEPGTGIGLTLTKELLELSGGKIELTSTEGQGTEVGLYFKK